MFTAEDSTGTLFVDRRDRGREHEPAARLDGHPAAPVGEASVGRLGWANRRPELADQGMPMPLDLLMSRRDVAGIIQH